MFCTDAATLLLYIIEYKWLQGCFDLFGGLQIIEAFHDGVEVKVSVGDVAMS